MSLHTRLLLISTFSFQRKTLPGHHDLITSNRMILPPSKSYNRFHHNPTFLVFHHQPHSTNLPLQKQHIALQTPLLHTPPASGIPSQRINKLLPPQRRQPPTRPQFLLILTLTPTVAFTNNLIPGHEPDLLLLLINLMPTHQQIRQHDLVLTWETDALDWSLLEEGGRGRDDLVVGGEADFLLSGVPDVVGPVDVFGCCWGGCGTCGGPDGGGGGWRRGSATHGRVGPEDERA